MLRAAISSGLRNLTGLADVIGSVSDEKGGTAAVPRVLSETKAYLRFISSYQSGWFMRAQPAVTVPRVMARVVPLTQMAA